MRHAALLQPWTWDDAVARPASALEVLGAATRRADTLGGVAARIGFTLPSAAALVALMSGRVPPIVFVAVTALAGQLIGI